MEKAENSMAVIDRFFSSNGVEYWLEAGTALAAYRDGKILPWEHDIDVAIWRETLPDLDSLISYFGDQGFDVVVQKNFPYIDNIVQFKVQDAYADRLIDVDLYLYTAKDEFAYMRWIHKPEGRRSSLKVLNVLKYLVNPTTEKWRRIAQFVPIGVAKSLFKTYLKGFIRSNSCIYHRFPETFFRNLKKIQFHGVEVNIAADTDAYLSYRYGENWNVPDSEFNQQGKWKKAQARVKLPLDLLPDPAITISSRETENRPTAK